jgi:deoxyribodipyrimidine photolyase-related protein
MSEFRRDLESMERTPEKPRAWLYVPNDQLSADIGPLSRTSPSELGVVLIESSWEVDRRPYHKQRIALVLANMRHFALEQAQRGFWVRYVETSAPHDAVLVEHADELGALQIMEPAERELRRHLAPLVSRGILEKLPHEGWLSTRDDFYASQPKSGTWRMDRFYRHMRKKTGILMKGGKPLGGAYSFDVENRQPWQGKPRPPSPPSFEPDAITLEVCDLVRHSFSHHPGKLSPGTIPATAGDANRLWKWATKRCLPHFGPFEDAMTSESSGLFHTRISSVLNLHRVLPRDLVHDAAHLDAPLASREGFVRQVLGWREFVHHVHRETDGLRSLPTDKPAIAKNPGDGGYRAWSNKRWPAPKAGPDGGARPNALAARSPLPVAFWGRKSGLHCLDTVVDDVWQEAYSHHITRLMILCNIAALMDIEPRQVADWFWIAYADAYDWVVEPNVLCMGLFATGDLMTTKPYVSGTPYINKMSDYCSGCRFDPAKNCPISSLYWAYLARHEDKLSTLPRLRLPLASLAKRSAEKRRRDRRVFQWVTKTMRRGDELSVGESPKSKRHETR